jgi:hypothetical protein
MQTFTLGTREMLDAMDAELPSHYDMSLNRSDMQALIFALATSAGFVGWDDQKDLSRKGLGSNPEELADRAMSLFSGIAETLGVEGV